MRSSCVLYLVVVSIVVLFQAILGMMGSQSLLHVGALSARLIKRFLVLMAVCSVRSSCVLYLVVVSIVVLFQAILGMMGSQSLLHVWALSVRLSEEFLVLVAVCSVRSSCVLYLVVVSIVVLSQAIL